jgi:hypothetical protein
MTQRQPGGNSHRIDSRGTLQSRFQSIVKPLPRRIPSADFIHTVSIRRDEGLLRNRLGGPERYLGQNVRETPFPPPERASADRSPIAARAEEPVQDV